jgi:hypothetical protein
MKLKFYYANRQFQTFDILLKKMYVVLNFLTLFSKKIEYLSTYVVGRNLTDLTDTT